MELILLFGPPYSGKGTQGELLAKELHYIHVSTGDILRREKQLHTAIGNRAQAYSKQGLLVPDDLLEILIEKALKDYRHSPGIILDGYPRTIGQAVTLDRLAGQQGARISHVLFLEVGKEELVNRGIARGLQSDREDDKDPVIIQRRIEVYEQETRPVAGYYARAGLMTMIRGEGSIHEITQRILEKVSTAN